MRRDNFIRIETIEKMIKKKIDITVTNFKKEFT